MWTTRALLLVVLVIVSTVEGTGKNQLSAHIKHYEFITYDTETLHNNHIRAKRSADPQTQVRLDFQAFGRMFRLRLKRDNSIFAADFCLEKSDGSCVPYEVTHTYSGNVHGEDVSSVVGSIIEGHFQGTINLPKATFHIETADRYFTDDPGSPSVIYKDEDVLEHPNNVVKASEHVGSCGNTQAQDWMGMVQNSAVERPVELQNLRKKRETVRNFGYSYDMYSREAQDRHRRETDEDKTACTLFLQSDTMLWERMTLSKEEKGLGYNKDRAHEEITSLFHSHVTGISKIYGDTVFAYPANNYLYKGINFIVRRIKINETDNDCPQAQNTPNNPFCNPNIDVSNFLNLNSLQNHTDFCLAYVFTYRDFTGGTLGLAWVGSPTKASGGICEIHKEYAESNGNRVKKSLNTGIVTLINYNSPVPPKVSTLTFAHEVGHNFGSPHDDGTGCAPFTANPSDPDGNYIMYASATSGDRPNNSKFSQCSIRNISMVLNAVFEQKNNKRNCFVQTQGRFCGNQFVEELETCDCGYADDCKEKCCYGRGSTEGRECTFRNMPGIECSPSQGPCCTADCKKVEKDKDIECSSDDDCKMAATCNGMYAECPAAVHKNESTPCNKNTQICKSGECSGSICDKINWTQCFLTTSEGEDIDKGTLCFVACSDPSSGSATPACVSTGDADALDQEENKALKTLLEELEQESIKLPPGAPCNDFRGYCDVFQKCRDVDADGPLARLKKLLFNQETFNDVRDWIIVYWWAVLLIGIGLIIFMGVFIKICAVHTPSSNPKKPPARKIMTLQRQRPPQGPPPPYSGPSRGGPPHGKGRRGQGRGQGQRTDYEMQKV